MRKKLFITVCGLMGVMTALAQPLLKTHVETGDLEGVLEGNDLACYYAIPFAAPLYDLYQKGEYNDVPVLIMHNSDEGAVEFDSVS